ncbi:ABC transporter ATP-binding protein [Ensifer canadensis]
MSVRNLNVQFRSNDSLLHIVRDVSYDVHAGQLVALVGESGCGKSVSSLAVMRLLSDPETTRFSGEARLNGREYLHLPEEQMRRLRGKDIAMVFQEPMTSLNPLMTVGRQIMEPMLEHLKIDRAAAWQRAIDLLKRVGVTDPERRMDQYPHEFSGGMRQRVVIAIALSCKPKVIIADEPTTALDVTIQAQILELLYSLVKETGVGLVLITHNLALVARYADRVNVMYGGRIVESGTVQEVLRRPRHRYTAGLLMAVPRLDQPRQARLQTIPGQPPSPARFPSGCAFSPRCGAATAQCASVPGDITTADGRRYACFHPVIEAPVQDKQASGGEPDARQGDGGQVVLRVRGLTRHFHLKRGAVVRAVDNVSFDIPQGGTLGLVGESGCGKTTVVRTLLRLQNATSGRAEFDGKDILTVGKRDLLGIRRQIQVVYQDPSTSLNPRHRIASILAEPLLVHGICKGERQARKRVEELLDLVGLPVEIAERYPHQMSGGQRQRVGIARALGMNPRLIICDEPVSALDVSIQAQIMNLLVDLQARLGLSYLFVAHDLAVVRHISDVVAVMYLGRVVETATRAELFSSPRHPYTRALLAAVPSFAGEERGRAEAKMTGELPSPVNPPRGCVFRTRCPIAVEDCKRAVPAPVAFSDTHHVACIRA